MTSARSIKEKGDNKVFNGSNVYREYNNNNKTNEDDDDNNDNKKKGM